MNPKKATGGARPATKAAPATKRAAVKRPAAERVVAPPPPAPLAEKAPKLKLVRDSFTIPSDEYDAIAALKRRSALLGSPAKKSEVLRAGVKALAAMDDTQFAAALTAVPAIKTGRPKAKKP
jgi:hypothetical protein